MLKKKYAFSKASSNSAELKGKNRVLKDEFLHNSQKTEILDLENINSEEIVSVLENINPDDHYIVKAYFYLRNQKMETIIITTDKPLMETLMNHKISVYHRDEFIKTYLSEHQNPEA